MKVRLGQCPVRLFELGLPTPIAVQHPQCQITARSECQQDATRQRYDSLGRLPTVAGQKRSSGKARSLVAYSPEARARIGSPPCEAPLKSMAFWLNCAPRGQSSIEPGTAQPSAGVVGGLFFLATHLLEQLID